MQTNCRPPTPGLIAAETGIEPISIESESIVIPLHYSAIADANGFEPLLIVLETIVLPVTLSIHTRVTGIKPILQESKSCVLTSCTTPYQLVGRMGFEPMTARLSDGNSYQLNYLPMKWEEQDSNLYRMELQPIALPLELPSQKENHLPLSDKWLQSKEILLHTYVAHDPHILIKTSKVIQFLILHQN